MAEELGRIERPEAESFRGKRKLYLVPLLFMGPEAPGEYIEILSRYWAQVKDHIARLEAAAGPVTRIYHESIAVSGQEGLKLLEKLNPSSCNLTTERCRQGAILEALDDRELNDEIMDWERFIMAGFISRKAADIVAKHYMEASAKRYEHMTKRIEETLKAGEASILFIREGHRLQFPPGIEVFSVSPPALDELYRWVRDNPPKEPVTEPEGQD
ncbi:MAG: hypothetical protein PHV74_00435 [Dehalococcoidia bacterium]|nr:hypothetical protein [Dehalococcoidia bacterium]